MFYMLRHMFMRPRPAGIARSRRRRGDLTEVRHLQVPGGNLQCRRQELQPVRGLQRDVLRAVPGQNRCMYLAHA